VAQAALLCHGGSKAANEEKGERTERVEREGRENGFGPGLTQIFSKFPMDM
jgi:hypothetical protein